MMIKLLTSYTAAGYATRLSEDELIMTNEELKESRGIHVLKVDDLSMHSRVDLTNNQSGYIILICSSKNKEYNVDETRYDYYNNEICIPFIESIR